MARCGRADASQLLSAAVPQDQPSRGRATLQRPGVAVRGRNDRFVAEAGLEAPVPATAVTAAIDGAQPPAVTVVVHRRALGEEAQFCGCVDRQRRGAGRGTTADGTTIADAERPPECFVQHSGHCGRIEGQSQMPVGPFRYR